MDYTVALCLEKIPGAVVKKVTVGGIEQQCICIPLDPGVFHVTKKGWRFLQVNLKEKEEMIGTETHMVYFSYPNRDKKGCENKEIWGGRCSVSQSVDMNIDKTNRCTFRGLGVICLDDIPEDAVLKKNGKRYVRIMATPLAELDRAANHLLLSINPDFGAGGGKRSSLNNGYDAPLVEIGRMADARLGDNPEVVGEQNEEVSAPEESRKIDGIEF